MASPLLPPLARPSLSSPNSNPLLSLLSHCNSISHLKQIHSQFIRSGLEPTQLLSFCCAHQDPIFMTYARQLFDEMPQPTPSHYNAIIRGYSNHNSPLAAVSFYLDMLRDSTPNSYTFPCLLKSFNRDCAVKFGDEIHAHAVKFGFWDNPYVQNVLIHMYSMSGQFDAARDLFERSSKANAVMWNVMMSGYNRSKKFKEACEVFREMQEENVRPSLVTLLSVLSACAKLRDLSFGMWVHGIIEDCGIVPSLKLQNALVEMYAMCGDMFVAYRIFEAMEVRDVVSWTSIVSGFAKSGELDRAREIFDQMPEKDIMSWTAMIDGYVRATRFKEALDLFRVMQETKICPDEFTVVSLLTACAQLGALGIGEWIKAYIDRKKIKMDAYVANALIDMYCKCGRVNSALEIFRKMPRRDKFAWTAIILGLAINGKGEDALNLFYEMLATSIKPDEITFIGVLSACTHSGFIDKGREFFCAMITTHNINPTVTHYGCLIDLLGRAGLLKEALETINNMPMKPNYAIWASLLSACRVYKDLHMAELACNKLIELDPENGVSYVLLCNIYAKCNKWDEVKKVKDLIMEKGIRKEPGCSLIEMNGEVHEFVAGDRSHARSRDIYIQMEETCEKLKLAGYKADTSEVFLDIREEEKESAVYRHSEKLAVAYGLISSVPGETIRVVKNLRMCSDCHNFMNLVSRLYRREIIVRDRTRFHHFRDGSCSCRDFW